MSTRTTELVVATGTAIAALVAAVFWTPALFIGVGAVIGLKVGWFLGFAACAEIDDRAWLAEQ